jgi:hypothetical protein
MFSVSRAKCVLNKENSLWLLVLEMRLLMLN